MPAGPQLSFTVNVTMPPINGPAPVNNNGQVTVTGTASSGLAVAVSVEVYVSATSFTAQATVDNTQPTRPWSATVNGLGPFVNKRAAFFARATDTDGDSAGAAVNATLVGGGGT
jgi:hypothetical protein